MASTCLKAFVEKKQKLIKTTDKEQQKMPSKQPL